MTFIVGSCVYAVVENTLEHPDDPPQLFPEDYPC